MAYFGATFLLDLPQHAVSKLSCPCRWPFIVGLGATGYIMLQIGLSCTSEPHFYVTQKCMVFFVWQVVTPFNCQGMHLFPADSAVPVQRRTLRTRVSAAPLLHLCQCCHGLTTFTRAWRLPAGAAAQMCVLTYGCDAEFANPNKHH